MLVHSAPMSWFDDGLCFSCTRCGNCCKGEGYVWVTPDEIEMYADRLGMTVDDFANRYVRQAHGKYSLREIGPEHRCVLLGDDDRCRVYEDRPQQCRTFPFWELPTKKRAEWEALKDYCPGIDRGRRYTTEEIREIMDGGST